MLILSGSFLIISFFLGKRLGRAVDEDPQRSLPTSPRIARYYDQCLWPHPSQCGEVYQEGNGSVCQQHHVSPLSVSQPAGIYRVTVSFSTEVHVIGFLPVWFFLTIWMLCFCSFKHCALHKTVSEYKPNNENTVPEMQSICGYEESILATYSIEVCSWGC